MNTPPGLARPLFVRSAGLMAGTLALTFLLFGLGCHSSDADEAPDIMSEGTAHLATLDELCRTIIADPDRRETALGALQTMVQQMSAHQTRANRVRAKVWDLAANYDATATDYAPLLDELRNERHEMLELMVRARFRLREAMTLEEREQFTAAIAANTHGDN